MWISLIGFMGSGKTTIARQAARGSTLVSMDLDELIERRYGQPVARIFEEHGEAEFRRRELAVLESLPADRRMFLACGGGTIQSAQARSILQKNGAVIWLDVPWHILYARLLLNLETRRPLVRIMGAEQLKRLYIQRQPMYAATADFRLTGIADNVNDLMRQVMYCRLRYLRQKRKRSAA